ncbi:alkylmercury lyase family protein [Tomitella gaofuii]|uniref:alkylmercury lyase family protein n=1 Tax=Tomitella gaofuii TaxID=2760083 RepID=UPI0015FDF9DA|nr:organomercurial lyase [Tomitella gaofuii]
MITPHAHSVRTLVYATFAEEGRAPSIAELARKTARTPVAVRETLNELTDAHAVVLSEDGDAIRMAHPFTATPMAFTVTPQDGYDDRRWWGGCAWDSFGISAALQLDVRIDTACPRCGAHLSYGAGPRTPPPPEPAIRFPRPAARWWPDVVATCTMIRAFCSRDHAEQWARQSDVHDGCIADAPTVWRLANGWYGDRLDPDFTPHTREHNQALLDGCGLTGPFWRLP